jgi:hypothetical protein
MCKDCGCGKPKKVEHTHAHTHTNEDCSEEKKKECHAEGKEKTCPKHNS